MPAQMGVGALAHPAPDRADVPGAVGQEVLQVFVARVGQGLAHALHVLAREVREPALEVVLGVGAPLRLWHGKKGAIIRAN